MSIQSNPFDKILTNKAVVMHGFINRFISIANDFFENLQEHKISFVYAPVFGEAPDIFKRQAYEQYRVLLGDRIKDLPLIGWSHTPIVPSELRQERGRLEGWSRRPGDTEKANTLRSINAEVDIQMRYFTNAMEFLEAFELFYQAYLMPTFEFTVDFQHPDLPGPFCYEVSLEDLSDMVIVTDEHVEMSVGFSARIKGDFFIKTGHYPYLREIVAIARDIYANPLRVSRIPLS